jgi:regulator of PEP synthase PpsR (kinase-PPPase family)
MKSDELTDSYVDRDLVAEEITWSRKLCARQGWPIIDVTRRSIEETAAAVIALLMARKPA